MEQDHTTRTRGTLAEMSFSPHHTSTHVHTPQSTVVLCNCDSVQKLGAATIVDSQVSYSVCIFRCPL